MMFVIKVAGIVIILLFMAMFAVAAMMEAYEQKLDQLENEHE